MAPKSIKKLIHAQVQKESRLNGERDQDPRVFHCSEIGDCPREIYFTKLGRKVESSKPTATNHMLLKDGHMHQKELTGYMKRSSKVNVTNIENTKILFVDDFIIMGHPDGVLHLSFPDEKGLRYLLEIKGLNRFNPIFKKDSKDFDLDVLKVGYASAILQTRIQNAMWNTNGGYVIVKCKDTSDLREYFIERDPKLESKAIDRFRKIRQALKDNVAPPCDYIKGDRACTFCKYPSECGSGK